MVIGPALTDIRYCKISDFPGGLNLLLVHRQVCRYNRIIIKLVLCFIYRWGRKLVGEWAYDIHGQRVRVLALEWCSNDYTYIVKLHQFLKEKKELLHSSWVLRQWPKYIVIIKKNVSLKGVNIMVRSSGVRAGH